MLSVLPMAHSVPEVKVTVLLEGGDGKRVAFLPSFLSSDLISSDAGSVQLLLVDGDGARVDRHPRLGRDETPPCAAGCCPPQFIVALCV